jgi:hypothetical protein
MFIDVSMERADSIFLAEYGEDTFLPVDGKCLPEYTASYQRRQQTMDNAWVRHGSIPLEQAGRSVGFEPDTLRMRDTDCKAVLCRSHYSEVEVKLFLCLIHCASRP